MEFGRSTTSATHSPPFCLHPLLPCLGRSLRVRIARQSSTLGSDADEVVSIEIKELGSGTSSLSSTPPQPGSRSTTPTPSNPMPDAPISRTGLLTIRVAGARGLSLPSGVNVPPVIQQALSTQQAQVASSVTSQSVSQQHRLAQKSGKRESLQRKQCWWLPYIVLEFDKNEILIDSLGGTIQEPVWMFQAHLYVFSLLLTPVVPSRNLHF